MKGKEEFLKAGIKRTGTQRPNGLQSKLWWVNLERRRFAGEEDSS